MGPMTTHERVQRVYAHQEADRIPVTDAPWGTTTARWLPGSRSAPAKGALGYDLCQ